MSSLRVLEKRRDERGKDSDRGWKAIITFKGLKNSTKNGLV